ncbi:hypothetical protein R3P38DRAFT_3401182, partial [Favolaschia claudopus]
MHESFPTLDEKMDYIFSRRHPEFYFSDGTALFELVSRDCPGGVLYKLHIGLLSHRSGFFATLFSLPRNQSQAKQILSEGTVDDNPIKFPSTLSRSDVDYLLMYLYRGPSMYPMDGTLVLSQQFLVSVLKLSTFFEIEDGIQFAIREFNRLGDRLHPALQFELARCCGIDFWIPHAFRRLMLMDITELDAGHVTQIGRSGYFWLTQTKAKMQALRSKIAFHVPPIVNSPECDTHDACATAWTREWQDHVRQLIHHPENPIPCVTLLHDLRNVHVTGLCEKCQDLTVTWLWGKCLFTQEEDLFEEAVQALEKLQSEEVLREAAWDSVL